MRNTCTSRVGIPCRFAARDPSTLGARISHTSLASIEYYYILSSSIPHIAIEMTCMRMHRCDEGLAISYGFIHPVVYKCQKCMPNSEYPRTRARRWVLGT